MHHQTPTCLQAAILDWAGTVVDFGSFAPTQIFVEAFATFDIEISLDEARGPMGMGKWDHIRTLCNQPAIADRFRRRFDRLPSDADVTALYERFMPLQIAKVAEFSDLIPGALECVAALRERELKIGTCSGYPRVVMEKVAELAARNGYVPDHVVATDDVPKGRPSPAQALANVIALGIDDVAACVKVDDTVPGILEGRHAGMWTVALRFSGNFLGMSWEAYQTLSADRLAAERQRIDALFAESRPHYLIDTIVDLPAVVDAINADLALGRLPQNT
ncbi:phosphonoacetaldehyde hydrolase [Pseudomonas sp. Marseille-QA0892]